MDMGWPMDKVGATLSSTLSFGSVSAGSRSYTVLYFEFAVDGPPPTSLGRRPERAPEGVPFLGALLGLHFGPNLGSFCPFIGPSYSWLGKLCRSLRKPSNDVGRRQ